MCLAEDRACLESSGLCVLVVGGVCKRPGADLRLDHTVLQACSVE